MFARMADQTRYTEAKTLIGKGQNVAAKGYAASRLGRLAGSVDGEGNVLMKDVNSYNLPPLAGQNTGHKTHAAAYIQYLLAGNQR